MKQIETKNQNYEAIGNGIVRDSQTGLEWIAGPVKNTTWHKAKVWVKSLKVGGGGWQMPTLDELEGLYEKHLGCRNMPLLLKTTGWWVWSRDEKGSAAARNFNFNSGRGNWNYRGYRNDGRAFAVRSRGDG